MLLSKKTLKLNAVLIGLVVGTLFPAAVFANQVCKTDSMVESTPDEQFVVHGDGTVTDTTTSLMWMQCPDGVSEVDCSIGSSSTYTWSVALQRVEAINNSGGFANYTDWRLPNIAELLSIVEEQCTQPAINERVFPNTDTLFFWTSSPNYNNDDATWFVDFTFGESGNVARDGRYPVRFVRSVISN